jgi:hypothetical protein
VKAFICSVLALAAIAVAAGLVLQAIPMPSSEVYSEKPNVRL